MDITIYLPDELGTWAKSQKLNLSQMLRGEVEVERQRRQAVAQTLEHAETFELDVEDSNGRAYTVRLHGAQLSQQDPTGVTAYLGEDERIYVYNERNRQLAEGVAAADLRGWLEDEEYIDAMDALGETAIIDVGQATG